MDPLLPQRGDGLWLHCFPKVGERRLTMGWDREGCAPAVCIFGAGVGIGKARRRMYFLAEASPQKRWRSELRPVLPARLPAGDWHG